MFILTSKNLLVIDKVVVKMSSQNLNILVVFNSLMGAIGGGSRHIIEVANYWSLENNIDFVISKAGYEVAKSHLDLYSNKRKSVKTYIVPFDWSRHRLLVYSSRIVVNTLLAIFSSKKYDIIIAPNYLPQNIIPAIFFKRSKNSHRVVYFHTTPPYVRKDYLNKLNCVKKSVSLLNWYVCMWISKSFFDTIFVVNEITKDYFLSKGFPEKNVFVTENGLNLDLIASIKPNNKDFQACFLGRLVENKGVFDLLDIWEKVVHTIPAARLCLIGNGPLFNDLNEKIIAKNLQQNIFLVGQQEGADKYELMKKSVLFVYPSYYEAQPVVVMEAIACDLRIIAYDLPCYDHFFQNCIKSVTLYDIDMFANVLISMLQCEESHDYVSSLKCKEKIIDWKFIANKQLSTIYRLTN